jgi:hypothetical protein
MYSADQAAYTDALVGGGRAFVEGFASTFAANMLRSMMPLIVEHGVATEEQLDIDTFDQRYPNEVLQQRSVIQWFPFHTAWGHKQPAA